MRTPSKTVAFAAGALTALALGGGTAYAANGGNLLIGRSNYASVPTKLTNSTGTALALTSTSSTPSLTVSSSAKVPNLNADRVDNLDGSKLALTTGRTGIVFGRAGDADGHANTATCPSGTVATGGGGFAPGQADYLWYSGPDLREDGSLVPGSWATGADGPSRAWVVCYNPRGAVPGAGTSYPEDGLAAMSDADAGAQKDLSPKR